MNCTEAAEIPTNLDDANVGLAFGLTIGAGMATTIGAALPFVMDISNPKYLSVSLGIAGGVMLYVSFVEILFKSVTAFEEIGEGVAEHASLLSTTFFFIGVGIIACINKIVHCMDPAHTHSISIGDGGQRLGGEDPDQCGAPPVSLEALRQEGVLGRTGSVQVASRVRKARKGPSSASSSGKRRKRKTVGDSSIKASSLQEVSHKRSKSTVPLDPDNADDDEEADDVEAACNHEITDEAKIALRDEHHKRKLRRTGLLTALAIGIHNLPEGLATFIGSLADVTLGIGLAVAIAIHNIPEGICVAVPVYYATGSKTKAFLWAFLSGVSEPIGALLGYILLQVFDFQWMFAVLFGIVSGMMVYIVLAELLPTARRYDPGNHTVTPALFVGMLIMAASLILFTYFV